MRPDELVSVIMLSKEVPIEPDRITYSELERCKAGYCKRCNDSVRSWEKYCHECGQRLDWSGNQEGNDG